jgi:transcriptional regulator with XRE-family HTH domain
MNLAEAGTIIREARKQAGLTQGALARRLGMDRGTISKMETGSIPEIGVRKYLAVCDALGLEFTVGRRGAPPDLAAAFAAKRQEQNAAAEKTTAILRTLTTG